MRRTAIRLEVMAQLELGPRRRSPSGPLRVVAAKGMDQTDRVGFSHRLGVGFARFAGEAPPLRLLDLYHLDGLSHEAGGPVARNHPGTKRRPDFLGSNAAGDWFILEAKGRSTTSPDSEAMARALTQTRAVYLEDFAGRPVPIAARLASIAALGASPVEVLLVDPPAEVGPTGYRVELDRLPQVYYQEVRDLLELGAEQYPLPGPAGRLGYFSLRTRGVPVELVVHEEILESHENPARLRAARRGLAEGWDQLRAWTREDPRLSIGLDGLGLFAPDYPAPAWEGEGA